MKISGANVLLEIDLHLCLWTNSSSTPFPLPALPYKILIPQLSFKNYPNILLLLSNFEVFGRTLGHPILIF